MTHFHWSVEIRLRVVRLNSTLNSTHIRLSYVASWASIRNQKVSFDTSPASNHFTTEFLLRRQCFDKQVSAALADTKRYAEKAGSSTHWQIARQVKICQYIYRNPLLDFIASETVAVAMESNKGQRQKALIIAILDFSVVMCTDAGDGYKKWGAPAGWGMCHIDILYFRCNFFN